VVGTSVRTITFNKTNTAPTAPVITGLTTSQRLGASGSISFNTSTDKEGDTLTYKLQFASNSAFTADLKEFSGSASPISFSSLPLNSSRYVRVVASDGKATTASTSIQVKIGNVLEFYTHPEIRSTRPGTAYVLLSATIDSKATVKVEVSNNANDATPKWEDATAAYLANAAHTFTNNAKTNANWAVAMHVIITANAATGTIEVTSAGLGVM
jgi:hypothetical protein